MRQLDYVKYSSSILLTTLALTSGDPENFSSRIFFYSAQLT